MTTDQYLVNLFIAKEKEGKKILATEGKKAPSSVPGTPISTDEIIRPKEEVADRDAQTTMPKGVKEKGEKKKGIRKSRR